MKSAPAWIRLIVFVIVTFFTLTAGYLWWQDAVSPVNQGNFEKEIFVIPQDATVREIATKLEQKNLIRSPIAFYLLVKFLGLETKLQAGDFRLSQSMKAADIAQELTRGVVDVWITTIEGWRNEEIAAKLQKELDIPESEFMKYAQEGYMFPDTYMIPRTASASAIVAIFRSNFDAKYSQISRIDAQSTGLNDREIITLASIVEREGRSDSDRPIIAGILINRLRISMPLQTDATLQYALGYQPQDKTWWKKVLYDDDKKVKSVYNTYQNQGLPPGPIANPGLSSIRAVVNNKKTEYLYYLHDPNGGAHYAVSLEEHNKNIDTYLR